MFFQFSVPINLYYHCQTLIFQKHRISAVYIAASYMRSLLPLLVVAKPVSWTLDPDRPRKTGSRYSLMIHSVASFCNSEGFKCLHYKTNNMCALKHQFNQLCVYENRVQQRTIGIITLCCHLVNCITIFPPILSQISHILLFLDKMPILLKYIFVNIILYTAS